MRSTTAHRGLALLAATLLSATLLLTAGVAIVLADSPLPNSINASVNGMTATVSGSWTWDGRKPGCDDKYAGWQVHWDDPGAPGNPLKDGLGFFVGTPGDNTVHTELVCAAAGSTGPMSHTYAQPGTYNVCIVMYDIHAGEVGKSGGHGTVAGGPDRNKDNSVEDGKLGLNGPGCTAITIAAPANLVVSKTVNSTSASPGDTLTWTIAIRNTGGSAAGSVDVSDDLSAALARGTFQGASNGGTLSGGTVRWNGLSVAAGASTTLTVSVKLNGSGWPSGATLIPNTVVVPNSNCTAGSSSGDCSTSTTVTGSPNLGVSLSVDKPVAAPGDLLSYTIRIENTGSASATNVSVSDNISALLARGSFVSASDGGSLNASTVTWSGITINAGASATLGFSIRLNATGWPGGSTALATTVVVPGSNCAAGSSNASCRAETTVMTTARLVVRRSVSPATADPGDTVTFSIAIENTGNASATAVTITEDASEILGRAAFQTASGGGSLSGSTIRWASVNVAVGATVTLTYNVRLDVAGWPSGTTTLRGTVTVPNSDCTGSAGGACTSAVSVTPRFAMTVTKGVSASQAGPFGASLQATAGETVWYSIRVTNSGNASLSGVTVVDSMGLPSGQCGAVPATLAPGASYACLYFRTASEGTTTNTVTGSSSQTSAVSASATVTAGPVPAPAIRLSVSASPSALPVGGGNVTYTYVVTNPGNVPLASVTVADDRCGPVILSSGDTNGNSRLDPAEAWRYSCTADLAGTSTSTATARGSHNGASVSATDRVTVTVAVAEPAVHLDTTVSPTSLDVGGGRVTYTYVVTNTGNAQLSNVTVSDTRCADVRYVSGDGNANSRLDLSETWRFSCSTTLESTTTNSATARGTFNGTSVTATDSVTVTVAENAPGIRVVKAANPTSLPAGGGEVTFTYVVTNTGNAALTNVTVSDDRCAPVRFISGDTDNDDRLDVSETWQYRCTMTLTSTTTNTVTASGSAGSARVADTDRTTVAVTPTSAAINVTVSAAPSSLPTGGGTVTYAYVVTNKGNVALSNVSVVDDVCQSVRLTGGDDDRDNRLDIGESWAFACSVRVTATTTNTALATGFSNGAPVTDTDQSLVTVGQPATLTPRIGLNKTANPVALPAGGGVVTYTYEVSNKGNAPLSTVSVFDDTCSPVSYSSGDADGDRVLDEGEAWIFSCTETVTQTTSNTAVARGTYQGTAVTASDQVTVTVAPATPTPSGGPTPAPTPGGGGSGTGSPTPTPSDGAPSPSDGAPTPSDGAPSPSDGSFPAPSDGSPGASDGGATGEPGASPGETGGEGSPGSSGTLGTGPTPTGSVQGNAGGGGGGGGATVPPGEGYIVDFQQQTPSGIVMIVILLLGVAASVVIMTLSKRTNGVA